MNKTEVYSWRLDPELKTALAGAARAEGVSLSRLLDRITAQWLKREVDSPAALEQQRSVRLRAMRYVGSVHGSDPTRARDASRRVRRLLAQKHARRRRAD